jgi:hypothetical protein
MKKEKVYCLDYNQHAGKWIYDGYQSAWEHLGYELQVGRDSENSQTTYSSPIPTNSELLSEEYYMMSVASLFEHSDSIKALQHSKSLQS